MPSAAFDITSPYSYFDPAARMVGISPTLATPAVSSNYFSRRIPLEPGRYRIRILARPAASFWVGSDARSMRMVANTAVDFPVVEEFDLYPGDTRFDVYLQNFNGSAQTAGFIFELYRQKTAVAYLSTKEGWVFVDGSPPLDAELIPLPDMRRRLPVWSLMPNWQGGILERLSWLTDIIPAEMGSEQRRVLREFPRRSMEASFLRTKAYRARIANFLVGVGTRPFLVPLWFEQYTLPGPLLATDNGISFPRGTLANREFRNGDLVLITNKDPDVFDVAIIEVIDIVEDFLLWQIKATRDWPTGSRVIPLRRAQVLDPPSLDNVTDGVGRTTLLFNLLDIDPGVNPSWGSGQVGALFTFKPNWIEALPQTFERVVTTLDNQLAAPHVVDISDQSRITQRMGLMIRGRQEVNRFRGFLSKTRGRAARFWMPTFTHDIVPTGDLSGDVIEGRPAQFVESTITRQFARNTIAIYRNDGGKTIYRQVVAVEAVGLTTSPTLMDAERYYLSYALEDDLPLSRVSRISWVSVVRFDQDTFELQHDVDNSRVVRASLVMRSVDPDGMEAAGGGGGGEPPIDH